LFGILLGFPITAGDVIRNRFRIDAPNQMHFPALLSNQSQFLIMFKFSVRNVSHIANQSRPYHLSRTLTCASLVVFARDISLTAGDAFPPSCAAALGGPEVLAVAFVFVVISKMADSPELRSLTGLEPSPRMTSAVATARNRRINQGRDA
jgi:hypothetical protein